MLPPVLLQLARSALTISRPPTLSRATSRCQPRSRLRSVLRIPQIGDGLSLRSRWTFPASRRFVTAALFVSGLQGGHRDSTSTLNIKRVFSLDTSEAVFAYARS